jgi:hypothetical protein
METLDLPNDLRNPALALVPSLTAPILKLPLYTLRMNMSL